MIQPMTYQILVYIHLKKMMDNFILSQMINDKLYDKQCPSWITIVFPSNCTEASLTDGCLIRVSKHWDTACCVSIHTKKWTKRRSHPKTMWNVQNSSSEWWMLYLNT